jgi:hypothetical protein
VALIGERSGTKFWRGDLRDRDHLEDLSIDGRIKLKWVFKKCDGIDLAQNRTRWRAFVNAVVKFRVA